MTQAVAEEERIIESSPSRGRGRPHGKRSPVRRFVAVTVQLDPELVADLDREIEAQGMESRSELIRTACRRHLDRQEKRRNRQEGD